ncbi:MAG: antitoxin [Candidatus Methanogaster sp.]|uniref:Antitoxin n=1 Tax=Candidatus Methanogaster sp. TaxID=3386292 RepID=A0AC61L6X5_9EURY|nr:MAG: antitoxin [ANME-2 cluster archaeon]
MELEDRIIIDPEILAGKPILRGTRIPVELLLEILANGWTYEEIFENYPQIGTVDILAALQYAADLLKEEHVYPISQKVIA